MRFCLPILVSLSLLGCHGHGEVTDSQRAPLSAPDLGTVVASVGTFPVYSAQVKAQMKQTGQTAREALQSLVDTLTLAAALLDRSRDQGLDLPSWDVRSAMVQRLLERDFEPSISIDKVPEAEVRALYDRVRDAFVHPRLVDVAVLVIYTGERMVDGERRARAQTAKELSDYIKKTPPKTLEEFRAIAQDSAWSARGVGVRKLTQAEDKPLSRPVGVGIARLRAPGDISPVLSDENGFYIAWYISERPAENRTFEDVRDQFVAGYYDRWRQQRFAELTDKLRSEHSIQMQTGRLHTDEPGP